MFIMEYYMLVGITLLRTTFLRFTKFSRLGISRWLLVTISPETSDKSNRRWENLENFISLALAAP